MNDTAPKPDALPFPDFDYGAFVLPFGKHKGRTLRAIDQEHGDRRYLVWLAGQNPARDVGNALRFYLED